MAVIPSGNPGMLRGALSLSLTMTLAPAALAGGEPPNWGYEFVTIGAVGNRATISSEVPRQPELQIGAVNYQYRITKTEVTGADWFEFVQAYAPFVGGAYNNTAFTSGSIIFRGFDPQGTPTYTMNPVHTDEAVSFGWRYAARYVNWLHNNKAITQGAFENGAYNTSTFTSNPNGTVNDQLAHNPGARFWIPTQDEWGKAAYYDPNKYGPGMEGYWSHPGGSDTPLQGGIPGEPGAQTSANVQISGFHPAVGSYPSVNAPWGLFDTSGGQAEWTETGFNTLGGRRLIFGSYAGQGSGYTLWDRIDFQNFGFSSSGELAGLRLASAIPAPGTILLLLFGATATTRRTRT